MLVDKRDLAFNLPSQSALLLRALLLAANARASQSKHNLKRISFSTFSLRQMSVAGRGRSAAPGCNNTNSGSKKNHWHLSQRCCCSYRISFAHRDRMIHPVPVCAPNVCCNRAPDEARAPHFGAPTGLHRRAVHAGPCNLATCDY